MIKKGDVSWGLKVVILLLIAIIIILATATLSKGSINSASQQTNNSIFAAEAKTYCYKECILCFDKTCACELPKDKQYKDENGKTIDNFKCSDFGASSGTTDVDDNLKYNRPNNIPADYIKSEEPNENSLQCSQNKLHPNYFENAGLLIISFKIFAINEAYPNSITFNHFKDDDNEPTKLCFWVYNITSNTGMGSSTWCNNGIAYSKDCLKDCSTASTTNRKCNMGCSQKNLGDCEAD